MTAWTDTLLAKLQVLLGDRSSDGLRAVRERDLKDVAITNKRQLANGVVGSSAIEPKSIINELIADKAVQARVIDDNSVQTRHILVIGTNLISNPNFVTGNFADWRPYANAGSQFVEARGAGSVPANAPAAFVCRHLHLSPGGISTFNGEFAFDVPGRLSAARPVISGESYRMTIDAVKNTGSIIAMAVSVFWLMADGTGTVQADAIITDVTNTWGVYSGIVTAPVGAVGAWPFVFTQLVSGGPVSVHWTNLSMRQMNAGSLTVDGTVITRHLAAGAVTADKVSVGTLSAISADIGTLTAGVARSPNYVPGISGGIFNLTTGFAEFNSLVVRRDMIVAGAVSKTITKFSSGTVTVNQTALASRQVIISSITDTVTFVDTAQGGGPKLVTLSGDIRKVVAGADARITFYVDRFIGGVWTAMPWDIGSPDFDVEVPAGYGVRTLRFSATAVFSDSLGSSPSQPLRLSAVVAGSAPFSGANVAVDKIVMHIEQLSR